MRKFKILSTIALAAVLALSAGSIAVAQSQCQQDCYDQLDLDLQACEDELAQKLADLMLEEQDCIDKWNGDSQQLQNCLKSINKRRRNAQRQYQQCVRQADNKLRVCLNQCGESPSAS